jgi:hypothetical protein
MSQYYVRNLSEYSFVQDLFDIGIHSLPLHLHSYSLYYLFCFNLDVTQFRCTRLMFRTNLKGYRAPPNKFRILLRHEKTHKQFITTFVCILLISFHFISFSQHNLIR